MVMPFGGRFGDKIEIRPLFHPDAGTINYSDSTEPYSFCGHLSDQTGTEAKAEAPELLPPPDSP